MSSAITLKVGNTTATLPIGANVTDAQVAAALTRYATAKGIPINGNAMENLTSILIEFMETVKKVSKTAQRAEKVDAALTAINAQVDTENNL